ncbi:Early nodulin-like protein 1 [Platanthera zijinensis]|uniref:Early nodulin-like protein 1 n=1 Tax=Platanthera zijinensis TaxID=2320716 RepID=A0AAP0B836_9ASPA
MSVLLALFNLTASTEFYVGGRNGWVEKPAESYNVWAEHMRFQVNDKLAFEYKKGEDSVLLVTKEAYNTCNTSNPTINLSDGNSVFVLDQSGPSYFISGAPGHCAQGQKLVVVVMAVRNNPPSSPPSPAPAPAPSPAPSGPHIPTPAPSSAQVSAVSTFSFVMVALFIGGFLL